LTYIIGDHSANLPQEIAMLSIVGALTTK
jgi:hypothetical protein